MCPCAQLMHTLPISPDLHRPDLALGLSHKVEVSFQLTTPSECGPDDGMPAKAISWNENNPLNDTAESHV